jgi:hypothetical protein
MSSFCFAFVLFVCLPSSFGPVVVFPRGPAVGSLSFVVAPFRRLPFVAFCCSRSSAHCGAPSTAPTTSTSFPMVWALTLCFHLFVVALCTRAAIDLEVPFGFGPRPLILFCSTVVADVDPDPGLSQAVIHRRNFNPSDFNLIESTQASIISSCLSLMGSMYLD